VKRVPQPLYDAYRRSPFTVQDGDDVVVLRVDHHDARVDALLAKHGAASAAWLTAWNPGSVPFSRHANRRRHRRLVEALGATPYLDGEGVSPDRQWRERGVFVLGVDREGARRLGARFGQVSIVVVARGAAPALVVV
jgi:hypothetical protein